MEFSTLVPELSVTDIVKTKWFYIDLLGFKLEYERIEDRFAYLSNGKAQIMIEEINGHWNTGELKYPFGRGINFQISVLNIEPIIERLKIHKIPLFREPTVAEYKGNGEIFKQKEFLVQDLDGYLLRFVQVL
ncbi:TPA: VOC family protein [Bacillus pseudomycoides]|nr:VOC family protein [Bacillus pseudomycoides]